MIKGHVQIELHNHKTGLRDRIEKDNLVTNAVSLVTNTLMGRGSNMSNMMPLATKAYGGLMIFEDPLVENVNNVCIPGNNLITGFAGQTLDTSDNLKGSINQAESGPTEDGYQHVWEFNTSQANGYISSLSLTNANVVNGIVPHFGSFVSLGNTNSNFYPRSNASNPNESFKMGNDFYYTTYSNTTATKNKLRCQTKNYTITEATNTTYTPEVVREITDQSSEDFIRLRQRCFWGNDGYIYSIQLPSSGNNINMYRAPLETTDPYTWSNKIIQSEEVYATPGGYFDAVSDGCLFRNIVYDTTTSQEYDLLKFIIDDYSEGEETTYSYEVPKTGNSVNNNSLYVAPMKGGGVFVIWGTGNNAQRRIAQLTKDGKFKIYRDGLPMGNVAYPLMWFDDVTCIDTNTNRTMYVPNGYLGTIANIDHPFEKTNTVSMKVKYTLTQV